MMPHMRPVASMLIAVLVCLAADRAGAESRFPQPEFESGYKIPLMQLPPPRSVWMEYFDVCLLTAAIGAASFLVLKKRSRRGVVLLVWASLLYFGFWRKGCVCPVGSIQNGVLALGDPSYTIPWHVLAFLVLPLGLTLLFGRTFCAAVCPLGAAQDVVVWRPVRLPVWLREVLRLGPYIYLALAVQFVMTGAGFLVCRFDPFVCFFRLAGPAEMFAVGAGVLLLGAFVARPYCRFLCPYGVLLGWFGRFAWRRVTITPDDCVRCRLCEDACPYDAILKPTPREAPGARGPGVRRLLFMFLLAPLVLGSLGWVGSRLEVVLSRTHPRVQLAERLMVEQAGSVEGTTEESEAFRSSEQPLPELLADAASIRRRYAVTGWWIGGLFGIAVIGRWLRFSVHRCREGYEPDSAYCLSCGRCYAYCPQDRVRRKASGPS
jgi:NosR/NirI family nitrous oxide reductase transcriptional regulator